MKKKNKLSLISDILARQNKVLSNSKQTDSKTRHEIAEIIHKHRNNSRKNKNSRIIDLWNDPIAQGVMKLAQDGAFSTEAIAEAMGLTPSMVQYRLHLAKMTSSFNLGMSRKEYRNGTSLLAQRKIKELLNNTGMDPLLIKHLDKNVEERKVWSAAR